MGQSIPSAAAISSIIGAAAAALAPSASFSPPCCVDAPGVMRESPVVKSRPAIEASLRFLQLVSPQKLPQSMDGRATGDRAPTAVGKALFLYVHKKAILPDGSHGCTTLQQLLQPHLCSLFLAWSASDSDLSCTPACCFPAAMLSS